MGGVHALDQPYLFFYVYPLHDHSCDQTSSIKRTAQIVTNYTTHDKNCTIDRAAFVEALPPSLSIFFNSP